MKIADAVREREARNWREVQERNDRVKQTNAIRNKRLDDDIRELLPDDMAAACYPNWEMREDSGYHIADWLTTAHVDLWVRVGFDDSPPVTQPGAAVAVWSDTESRWTLNIDGQRIHIPEDMAHLVGPTWDAIVRVISEADELEGDETTHDQRAEDEAVYNSIVREGLRR